MFPLTAAGRRLPLLLFPVFLPNPIAELLHAVKVRVVQEGEEVSVPKPVLGRVTSAASRRRGKSRQDVTQFLGRDDLQVEA